MLPHYSPLKVAETFSVLAALFPGRIDLGLGRAAGTDPADHLRAAARPPPGRPRRLSPAARRAARISRGSHAPTITRSRGCPRRCPGCPSGPSRGCSAPRRRARCGRPSWACRTRSRTSSTPRGAEIAALYRERFAEHEHGEATARTAVAVWVICADSDEEATRVAASGRMTFTLLRRGQLIAVPPPEEALRFLAADERRRRRAALAPARAWWARRTTVRAQLEEVMESYGCRGGDRGVHHLRARGPPRCYELLAGARAGPSVSRAAA